MDDNQLKLMFSSKNAMWETPKDVFDSLNLRYNFNLDACALPENAMCQNYITPEENSLSKLWEGVVYCNPPYGNSFNWWKLRKDNPDVYNEYVQLGDKEFRKRFPKEHKQYRQNISDFIKQGYLSAKTGSTVVMLITSRTDVKWFHKYVWDNTTNQPRPGVKIHFCEGRLKFTNRFLPSYGADGCHKIPPAPFPSMIVIFTPQVL